MKTFSKFTFLLIFAIGIMSLAPPSSLAAKASQDLSVDNLVITGEIDLLPQGYIIRGTSPAEIFTILNPDPDILDKIIKQGKNVELSVKVVSGDNVQISLIDGKEYP